MSWFHVDDGFPDHPKVLLLQSLDGWESAVALWTLAGAWSGKHLTEGRVSTVAIRRLGFSESSARLLVAVGLWSQDAAGYLFCGWLERNPSRSDVEEKRAANAARVAKHRARLGNALPAHYVTRDESISNDPLSSPLLSSPISILPEEKEEQAAVAAMPLALAAAPANETERRKKPRDATRAELRKAIAALSAEFGHDVPPTPSDAHVGKGALKVAALVKAGSELRPAAERVARCALQWFREARSSTFGFSLQDCIVGAAATAQVPSRNGKLQSARGTTEVDFANVPSVDEQLAAHARARAEGAAARAAATTYSFAEILEMSKKKAGSHV